MFWRRKLFSPVYRVFTRFVRSRCSLFSHAAGLRSFVAANFGTLRCHFPRSINKFEVSIHIAYTLIICWFICVRLEHKFNMPPNRVSPAQQCRCSSNEKWSGASAAAVWISKAINFERNASALCYVRKCFRWYTYLPYTGGGNSCCKKLLIKTTRNNLIWIGE